MFNHIYLFMMLAKWHTHQYGYRKIIFLVGKITAVVARILLIFGMVVSIIWCFIDVNFLFLFAFGVGPITLLLAFSESIGRLLMRLAGGVKNVA